MDFSELELMAAVIGEYNADHEIIHADDIKRWAILFGLSSDEAISRIREFRDGSDPYYLWISDGHWAMISSQYPVHNKESYCYSLHLAKTNPTATSSQRPLRPVNRESEKDYLIKIEGPLQLSTAEVLTGAKLPVMKGTNESDESTQFILVNGIMKDRIIKYAVTLDFKPTIISISIAEKDLHPHSIHPTLGLDSTLPQHRLSSPSPVQQDTYPVRYFFYGTLSEPDRLARLLGSSPVLEKGCVSSGAVKMWGGKYKALVDTDGGSVVEGYACWIRSVEEERELRVYETGAYEVVRCEIRLEKGGVVAGLTFRFVW